jgi:hypothetical protein
MWQACFICHLDSSTMSTNASEKREREEEDDNSAPIKKKKLIGIEEKLFDAVSGLQEHFRSANDMVTDLQERVAKDR